MFDLVGEEIKVGSLIAFSKGNEPVLSVGIVIEIHADKIKYPIKSFKKVYKTVPARPAKTKKRKASTRKLIKKEGCMRKGYIKIDRKMETQGRIVVIKNPMFLLDNPNIAAQLEIMDMAKDAGYLPANYELGVPTDITKEV